jgi:hypothetical protein
LPKPLVFSLGMPEAVDFIIEPRVEPSGESSLEKPRTISSALRSRSPRWTTKRQIPQHADFRKRVGVASPKSAESRKTVSNFTQNLFEAECVSPFTLSRRALTRAKESVSE